MPLLRVAQPTHVPYSCPIFAQPLSRRGTSFRPPRSPSTSRQSRKKKARTNRRIPGRSKNFSLIRRAAPLRVDALEVLVWSYKADWKPTKKAKFLGAKKAELTPDTRKNPSRLRSAGRFKRAITRARASTRTWLTHSVWPSTV